MKTYTLSQVRRIVVTKAITADNAEEALSRFKEFWPPLGEHMAVPDRRWNDRPCQILKIEEAEEAGDD